MGGGGKSGGSQQEQKDDGPFRFSAKEGSEEEARAAFAKRREELQSFGGGVGLAEMLRGYRAGQVVSGPGKTTQGFENAIYAGIDMATGAASGAQRKIDKYMSLDLDVGSAANQLSSGNFY